MDKKNKYDAFISYRHCELDKFVAVNLHKKLEAFKLPKDVTSPVGKTKIERVFRDQDELPLSSNLSDPINEALESSDYLVVICTPRLPESEWCKREIETFIKLHGREKVLAVLAEGEPHESFPEALTKEAYEVTNPDGSVETKYHYFEPLAADVRGKNNKEILKAMNDAVLRVAASIFGLSYDDLKQRHKERAMKRTISIVSAVAAAMMLFSAVCMAMMFKIIKQSEMIMDQNDAIMSQNDEIKAQSAQIQAQSEQIQEQYEKAQLSLAKTTALNARDLLECGRKFDAIYALRKVMPSSSTDDSFPYSPETENALSDILEVYTTSGKYVGGPIFESESTIEATKLSDDGSKIVTIDSTNNLLVWDTVSGKQIFSKRINYPFNLNPYRSFIVVDENNIVYNDENQIKRYDLSSNMESVLSNPFNSSKHRGDLYRFAYANKCILFTDDGFEIIDLSNYSSTAILYTDYINIDSLASPYIYCVTLSEDGNELFFGATMNFLADKLIYKYDINSDTLSVYNPRLDDINSFYLEDNDLYFSGCEDALNPDAPNYIISIDKDTFKENWRTKTLKSIKGICLSSEKKYIYAYGYDYVYALETDGTLLNSANTSFGICNMYTTINNNGIVLFSENSKMLSFTGDKPNDVLYINKFENPPSITAESFYVHDDFIVVSYKEKNYISLYKEMAFNPEPLFQAPFSFDVFINSEDKFLIGYNTEERADLFSINSDSPDYSVEQLNSNVTFVGDGKDYFAEYGKNIRIFNVSDGSLFKEVPIEKCPYFNMNSVSYDQNYILSDPSDLGQLYLYSLTTGEVECISKPVLPDEGTITVYNLDKNNYAIKRESGAIDLYKSEEKYPYMTLNRIFSSYDKFEVCRGTNLICASFYDGTVEFYRFGETTELIKTLYLPDSLSLEEFHYYPEKKMYVLKYNNQTYTLDEDLNITAKIPWEVYYLPKSDTFAFHNKDCFYSIPHYKYDDLMRISDELLGDYLPSQSTMDQYGILN